VCRHLSSIPGALNVTALTTGLVLSGDLMLSISEVVQDGARLAVTLTPTPTLHKRST
jgi:hypothetical protein